ncbi:Hypothetical protein A7982_05161 [Minicystis rosea]|nr:Hypothetical protein A7982_05161 [Minicystis rosea]
MHPTVWITVLVMGGYLLVARLVGNVYPFSTFSMYSEMQTDSASHLVARDRTGKLHDVTAYDGWSCPEPLDIDPPRCREPNPFSSIGYIDRASLEHVRASHATHDGQAEPVDLVRHIWRFQKGSGDVRTEDCLLAQCQAVRR